MESVKFAIRKYECVGKHFVNSKPLEIVIYGTDHELLVKCAKALSENASPFSYSVEELKTEECEASLQLVKQAAKERFNERVVGDIYLYRDIFVEAATSTASQNYHYSETILPCFRNQLGPVACLVSLLGVEDVQISITDSKVKEIFDEELEKSKRFLEYIKKN